MAPTPGNQEQANELQKVCAKIAKLEEELEAGKGDNELKRSLAKRLAALEEQKTLLMRQSSGGTGAVAGTVTAEEVAGMVKAIQDQAGMVKAIQDQLSGLNISPRLSASTIKHVKDSMFLIFQEGTRSMLTATALAALASNVPYVPSGSGVYTGDMFVGAGFFYRQPGLAVTPAHQLTKMQIDGGEAVRILAPSSRKELVLKVVKVDSGLDFAYLRLEGAAPEPGAGADFLVAHGESLSDVACRRVTLFTANIGQWRQLGEALPNALITQCSANFSLVGSKNMTYTATTFKGDCGCPVIMTSSGELAGMHTEMIDEYEWSTGSRKRKVDARLSDLESSAASSGPHEAVALQASAFPPVPAL